jgi:hypothetical protein
MAVNSTTVRMRRTVEQSGSGGAAAVTGPFLEWCSKPYPGGDDKTMAFVLCNLPEDAIVLWELLPSGEDVELVTPEDARLAVVVSQGSAGSIRASLNGEIVGTLAFTHEDCA